MEKRSATKFKSVVITPLFILIMAHGCFSIYSTLNQVDEGFRKYHEEIVNAAELYSLVKHDVDQWPAGDSNTPHRDTRAQKKEVEIINQWLNDCEESIEWHNDRLAKARFRHLHWFWRIYTPAVPDDLQPITLK